MEKDKHAMHACDLFSIHEILWFSSRSSCVQAFGRFINEGAKNHARKSNKRITGLLFIAESKSAFIFSTAFDKHDF
jgi:hypothetical protein